MEDNLRLEFLCSVAKLQGGPHQVLALRRALGWSRQKLDRYLGLYVNPKDCYTIYRWEKGLARPRPCFREILAELAVKYLDEYWNELEQLSSTV